MRLNENQAKLVGLTMELDLRAREYKMLCEKLDRLKENTIDEKYNIVMDLKREFLQNYEEIVEINKQIKEVKEIEGSK